MTRCCGDALLIVLLSVVLGASFAEAQLSEFEQQKAWTHFTYADADGSGTLEEIDYTIIVIRTYYESCCKKYPLEQLLTEIVPAAWAAFPNRSLNFEQYLEEYARDINSTQFAAAIDLLASIMYDLWNCNQPYEDDAMYKDELTNEFIALRIDLTDLSLLDNAFASLDADTSGGISLDEYTSAGVAFFTSDNPNDLSRYFFGDVIGTY